MTCRMENYSKLVNMRSTEMFLANWLWHFAKFPMVISTLIVLPQSCPFTTLDQQSLCLLSKGDISCYGCLSFSVLYEVLTWWCSWSWGRTSPRWRPSQTWGRRQREQRWSPSWRHLLSEPVVAQDNRITWSITANKYFFWEGAILREFGWTPPITH